MSSSQTVSSSPDDQPLWTPSPERQAGSLLVKFKGGIEAKSGKALPDYPAIWKWSIDQPEGEIRVNKKYYWMCLS